MNTMEEKYKVGATIYDEDNMLWETKIGLNDKKMTLLYSVWGKTEQQSKDLSKAMIEKLLS